MKRKSACRFPVFAARWGVYALFCLFCVLPVTAKASADPGALKLTHVVNLLKFINWPEAREQSSSLVLCVLGNSPFGPNINGKERQVRGKPVRIIADIALDFTQYCHALYISDSEAYRLLEVLQHTRGQQLLTVSGLDGFHDAGGMIEIRDATEGKVGFRVNHKAAEAESLRISSKLLTLSR